MTFKVKVCGITRPVDASRAVRLGADLIGMIFYRYSPRYINKRTAFKIIDSIPPTIDRVGVFVDTTTTQILKLARSLQLDFIQLHGEYGPGDIRVIQKEGFKVIRAFHVMEPNDYNKIMKTKADLVLLDNREKNNPGGTGKPFDWQMKPKHRLNNLILAGGISAENVEEGIRKFRPIVIDVNSGVESSPGIKSPAKLRRFFEVCNRLRYGS